MSSLGDLQNDFEKGIKEFAEWAKEKTQDEIKFEMTRSFKTFWDKQPWYLKLFKPFIMKEAYKLWDS